MMSKKNNSNTIFLAVARCLVGLLFILSGLIKLNDPVGFSYKLDEYFEVFHSTFLSSFSVLIAVVLCALEVILGVFLLAGIYAKKVAWGLFLLIAFFTFLTFYSAYFNVVKSCGCFGDAIPLTPWQSFSKDLVLLVLIVYIFFNKSYINPLGKNIGFAKLISIITVILTLLFGFYTWYFQPIIDFLPYKVGANIPQSMVVPEGAPRDVYEIIYTLKNKKTGQLKTITDKEYLATKIYNNPDYEYVSATEPKLLKKGFTPKIVDLKVADAQGVDYTKEIFENPYYNLVAVAWNLDEANERRIGDINALALNAAENYNIRSVLLTANAARDAETFSKEYKLVTEIFYADAVPLKSMVRSNPGLLLIKNGTVINKWPSTALPSYNELEKYFTAQ